MPQTVVNKNEYFFPLITGRTEQDSVIIDGLLGTAFSIDNRYFMTAGHCLPGNDQDQIFIGFEVDGHYRASEVEKYEILAEIDIGIVKLRKSENVKSIGWIEGRVHDSTLISASGFAFGLDKNNGALYNRTFKGYTVSSKRNFRFRKRQVKSYELSFLCPKGLSGSPIIDENKGGIVGVIQGNASVSIEVDRWTEKIDDGKQTKTFVSQESMTLGEAIQVKSILDEHSQLFGMTIGDFLKGLNRIT